MHTQAYRERKTDWSYHVVLPIMLTVYVHSVPLTVPLSVNIKDKNPFAFKTHNKMSLINALNFCVAFILQSFVAAVVFANLNYFIHEDECISGVH